MRNSEKIKEILSKNSSERFGQMKRRKKYIQSKSMAKRNSRIVGHVNTVGLLLVCILLASVFNGCSEKRTERRSSVGIEKSASQTPVKRPLILKVYRIAVTVLLTGIGMFLYAALVAVLFHSVIDIKDNDKKERFIRLIALFMGFVLYYIVRLSFFSDPRHLLAFPKHLLALADLNQKPDLIVYGVVIPFAASILFTIAIARNMKIGTNVALRLNLLLGFFIITLLTEILVYGIAVGAGRTKLLAPYFSFIFGLSVCAIFYDDNEEDEEDSEKQEDEPNDND